MEQEEARQLELVDQRKLALQAGARPCEQRMVRRWVAVGEGVVADRSKLPDRRLDGIGEIGIAITELLGEVELQALCQLDSAGGSGEIDACKAVGRLCGSAQDALTIATPLLLAAVEGGVAADRHERVLKKSATWCVGVHVAGGNGLDAEVLGEIAEGDVAAGVAAIEWTLQLDEEVLAPERGDESGDGVRIVYREPVAGATGEADETVRVLLDEILADGRCVWLAILTAGPTGTRVRFGEDAAEVRIAPAGLDEQGQMGTTVERHLGAGDRPDAQILGSVGELERAVDTVVVGERECRVAELGRTGGELFREGRTVEKRVRRVAVQLDVGHAGRPSRRRRRLSARCRTSARYVLRRIVASWATETGNANVTTTSSTRFAPGTMPHVPRRCSGCRA